MLYLVATPIGNLEDITFRAIRILSSSDYILSEDRRKSQILLQHYGIKKELVEFHKFCEKKREKKILEDLCEGKQIALISDAGSPLLSDPGQFLIQSCIERKLPFTSIPGPSSLLNALLLSGLETIPFLFMGFLDKKKGEREKEIKRMLFFSGTSLCFETPTRIQETLQWIDAYDPNRHCVIAREMTKKFEECLRGNPKTLLEHFQKNPPLGEMVLLLSSGQPPIPFLQPEELLLLLQEFLGLEEREAIKTAAKLRKIPKRSYYNALKKKE
jgi:16S rRNA (cytidine1402-2'-O)-methyltransferase